MNVDSDDARLPFGKEHVTLLTIFKLRRIEKRIPSKLLQTLLVASNTQPNSAFRAATTASVWEAKHYHLKLALGVEQQSFRFGRK